MLEDSLWQAMDDTDRIVYLFGRHEVLVWSVRISNAPDEVFETVWEKAVSQATGTYRVMGRDGRQDRVTIPE